MNCQVFTLQVLAVLLLFLLHLHDAIHCLCFELIAVPSISFLFLRESVERSTHEIVVETLCEQCKIEKSYIILSNFQFFKEIPNWFWPPRKQLWQSWADQIGI